MSEEMKKTILDEDALEEVSGGTTYVTIQEVVVPDANAQVICQCPKCGMSVEGKRIGNLAVEEFVCPNCGERFEITGI